MSDTSMAPGAGAHAPAKLDACAVQTHLARLSAWSFREERGGLLSREYVFADFAQAFGFMAQVAIHAEGQNHHPEWFNVYNRVSVVLTTHDVSGVSLKDVALAEFMDRCAAALQSGQRP